MHEEEGEDVWDSMRSSERNQLKDKKRGDVTLLKQKTKNTKLPKTVWLV